VLGVAAEQLALSLDIGRVVALLPSLKLVPDGDDLCKLVVEPLPPGGRPVDILVALLARPRLLGLRSVVVAVVARRPASDEAAGASALARTAPREIRL
jgi:hypothetical protein